MAGIISYGAYIPKWRLSRDLIAKGLRGEKAIAGPDEDAVTMGVAAVLDCLNGVDRASIDGLFFASTSSPYKEKQISTIIAAAADLRRDIFTADFANSLRAGTAAMKAAADAVKAGSAKRVMVVASDCRLGAPDSPFEQVSGDGAAAFLIGEDDVSVSIEASHSIFNEMMDVWRTSEDIYVRFWEDRFIQTQGYLPVTGEAISGLMNKTKLGPKDFSKLVAYSHDPRRLAELARGLGFDPKAQLQDPLPDSMGNSGTAYPLMLLVAALEEAKAGDKLLLASYGNGSDAFALEVAEQIEKNRDHRGIKVHLESKRMVPDYTTYLKWRKMLPKGMVIDKLYYWTYPSAPPIYRERNRIYPLHGVKCKSCGKVQYPPQRVCVKCGSKDNFEEVRLSDKKGTLHSFATEFVSGQLLGTVNFEGGGRMWCNITDTAYEELKIGMPMEMSFREVIYDFGVHNYFWKAIPVRA
ncbi:MAG: hydroxymethylglutaryl-CoA synthase family protein [Deltaproteobacteria bacterium]|nr:hydroxymethylglutaryl-CoA synthase family protein [Deltaproteobacteria bacterium]